jgi:hypothetical protein
MIDKGENCTREVASLLDYVGEYDGDILGTLKESEEVVLIDAKDLTDERAVKVEALRMVNRLMKAFCWGEDRNRPLAREASELVARYHSELVAGKGGGS